MDRRTFLKASGCALFAPMIDLHGSKLDFSFALIQHGQHWDARKRALVKLGFEIKKRCNIPIQADIETQSLENVLDVRSPFLVLSGKGQLPQISQDAGARIRTCLSSGGILLFDNQAHEGRDEFRESVLAIVDRIYPGLPPQAIPSDHSVYQSYYLLKEPRGRLNAQNYLEGWSIADRTHVFLSHNDLLGALEADRIGNWTFNMEIGGGFRRELCFRLGINMVYYTLTLNYKKDRAFPPVIERRRRQ